MNQKFAVFILITYFAPVLQKALCVCVSLKQGTPALPQSSIAADLLKGTITKLATEDLSSADKGRGEQLAKGPVIYEGKSGHIRSYDRMCFKYCFQK